MFQFKNFERFEIWTSSGKKKVRGIKSDLFVLQLTAFLAPCSMPGSPKCNTVTVSGTGTDCAPKQSFNEHPLQCTSEIQCHKTRHCTVALYHCAISIRSLLYIYFVCSTKEKKNNFVCFLLSVAFNSEWCSVGVL